MHHSKGFKRVYEKRKPNMFVCHWDVCLNSETCYKILSKRGISIHFAIDNDGTIFQFLDMNHIAWHAGSSKWNKNSVGVEISNAYYPKYNKTYIARGHGERELITGQTVHGKPMKPFMAFYPIQIQALKDLMASVSKA